ncbi:kinesin-like protein KIF18A isoform X2 [Antedon mediterranea]|uniref:kinesin-like protein KIF18A isoform X2 n=1 Tax=Antedon mediterranea TaxID=105859 RepID=UPI003AF97F75
MTSKRSNIALSGSNEKSTNVRVVIRVRPENSQEAESGSRNIIEVLDDQILIFDPKEQLSPQFYHGKKIRRRNILVRKNKDLRFGFDCVFDKNATQQSVYESTTKPVIDGLMNGYNCSVFAYGATGAGKTFTMLGNGTNCPGVIFLTMMELYNRIQQVQAEKVCDIAVSYLEIYNETIRDLLVPSGALAVREDPQKGVCVTGLSVHKPASAQDLFSMLQFGNKNRTQHPTDANAQSSRSHAVFQVFVRQKDRTGNLNADVKLGKMSLIDLAGSERAIVTRNRGARFQEGANINRSLLALGSCINALASNKKDKFVPYRNSKLTRLLKDSLGGNCNTVMIAAVSPSSLTYDDTYNTLRYADRAKNIKSQVKSNVVNVNFHVTQYTKIISDLRLEISELKDKLKQNTSRSSNDNSNKESQSLYQQQDIIKYNSLLYDVFTQRASIRKELLELESSDRDLSWKISCKTQTIERLRLVYGNQVQGEKTMSKFQRTVAASEARHARVKNRKIDVKNRMEKNEEWLQNSVTEMSSLAQNGKLPEVLQMTLRTRHLEIEVKDLRRQVKHLTKFCRQQGGCIQSSERLIATLLNTIRKQFYLIKGSNIATSETLAEFENIQKQVEGEREVLWADMADDPCSDVNSLLELPVLSGVRTTPEAPTMGDTYVIQDNSSTPLKRSNSDKRAMTARNLNPKTANNRNPETLPNSLCSTTNCRQTFTSETSKNVAITHQKSALIGTPMRVCTPRQNPLGTPMRVRTPHKEGESIRDHQSTMNQHTHSTKSVNINKDSSFTIEGVCPLDATPNNRTVSAGDNIRLTNETGQVLSYAKVVSTPKRQAVSRRVPLTDIAVNSPHQSLANPKAKTFQQKTRTKKFMTDKVGTMPNKNAAAVRALGLPSMSDCIQGKKRAAPPAYMMLTTAAKNKRTNNHHTRSSSEHKTPFSALPSRVRNSRAVPSRNVTLARTKSVNGLRSTWK